MRSQKAKVLHEILGRPILGHVLDTLQHLGVRSPAIVVGSNLDQVRSFIKDEKIKHPRIILQKEQKGTGHAVMMAENVYRRSQAQLLIWPGDMPLIQADTIRSFLNYHRDSGCAASVLSAVKPEPKGYGRILRSGGGFYAIREELDATESERRIQEVNTGIYLFDIRKLFHALAKLKPSNAKKEYYLTDTIEILSQKGGRIEAFPLAGFQEAQGINSRAELAESVKVMSLRENQKHMASGVTIVSPEQTLIEPGAQIGQDTVIYPWTYIESGVKIGKKCTVGPFAKIRKGSVIGDDVTVGSFVEINRSKLGNKVLAKHLTYLGDAELGAETNIGAGTIIANYDGRRKHRTKIGKKVLVGSNTVFIAPVKIGDRACTGAGSVILAGSRVPKGAVMVGVPAKNVKSKHKKQRGQKK